MNLCIACPIEQAYKQFPKQSFNAYLNTEVCTNQKCALFPHIGKAFSTYPTDTY